MSLLSDLQGIDLSGIVSARGSITASLQAPALQSLLQGGAAQAALGGLGDSIGRLRGSVSDPAALLKPIVDAVGGISGHLDIGHLPLPKLLDAVGEGVAIVLRLVEGIDRSPAAITRLLGFDLEQALEAAAAPVIGSYTQVGGGLSGITAMIERAEQGVPLDPQGFADMAIDLLLPIPRDKLTAIRTGVDAIASGALAIDLRPGRNAGMLAALNAVATAGAAGDATALSTALATLQRARANTVQVLIGDAQALLDQAGALHLDQVLAPLADARAAFGRSEEGVLEFLARWKAQFAGAHVLIDSLDPVQLRAQFAVLVQYVEDLANEAIVTPIERQVQALEAYIRGLLAHLPVRAIRAEISDFLHRIADAISSAGIDDAAKAVHAVLAKVQGAVGGDLVAEIKGALEHAQQVIVQALDPIISALQAIGSAITAVAAQAKQILDRASGAITAFAGAVAQVKTAIDNLGVEQAGAQIVEMLHKLRQTAEAVLTAAPLPEPLRPVVEQLVHTLEGIDFDVVFRPVKEAVASIQVPPDVTAKITAALHKVSDMLTHLIPSELIASLEAEIAGVLGQIRSFNPGKLLDGVTRYLNEAAQFIDGLDPTAAVDQIRAPFKVVLDAIDAAHPRKLLAPVIDAYNSALGHIQIPAPDTTMQVVTGLFNQAGEGIAAAAMGPIGQLGGAQPAAAVPAGQSGGASGSSSGSSSGGAAPAGTPAPPPVGGVRPGDIIRLFGFLPRKLHDALVTIEAGPAGTAIAAIDRLTAGLARDLRGLQAVLHAIETRLDAALDQELLPLGQAQTRAQLAIHAGFGAGSMQASASVSLVATASPEAMRTALAQSLGPVRTRLRALAHGAAGSAEASIGAAATALERCQLAGIVGNLEGFLAALDPEPLAAELDALVFAALKKAPALLKEIEDDLNAAAAKLTGMVKELNPGAQAQKFVRVLDVLRQELELLNPARLADELGAIHAAIRSAVAAYDPAIFAAEIRAVLQSIAQSLRALDPAHLLGDMTILNDLASKVENAVPTKALAGVGTELADVGAKLVAADPAALLQSIGELGPRIVDAFEQTVASIRTEIVGLLESIRYASGQASASVSVAVH